MIFSIISNQGRVLFSKNDAPARVIMHVDVRIVYINILLYLSLLLGVHPSLDIL
jgi:hypothetical protein